MIKDIYIFVTTCGHNVAHGGYYEKLFKGTGAEYNKLGCHNYHAYNHCQA